MENREDFLLDEDSINIILGYVQDSNDELVVEKSDIEELDEFESLEGFKFEIKCVGGDHRNDGQMVDYEIIITNPEGKFMVIETEMCLSVWWNVPWGTYDLKEMVFKRK